VSFDFAIHPKPARKRLQMSKSTLTADHTEATRIATNIHAFLNTPALWDAPPDGYHPRAYQILNVLPRDPNNAGVKSESLAQSLRILGVPARMAGIDPSPTIDRAQKTLDDLTQALKHYQSECTTWKQRAIAAEAQLSRLGRQANKNRAAIEGLTLQDAHAAWVKSLEGDPDYIKNQTNDTGIFVRRFGESTKLTDMAGRENEIQDWLREFKRPDGKVISPSRRRELRRVTLSFLKASGAEMERSLVKRPGARQLRAARGTPKALTGAQAKKVAANFDSRYFEDCFRVQVALGLRPGELITLKRSDFVTVNGVTTLTLSALGNLTLKLGPRTMVVPAPVCKIINERLKSSEIVFVYHAHGKTKDKPWPKAKNFDDKYLKALRAAGKAAGVPFEMDCRVARRTCATTLLLKGVSPKIVADILGDNLQTVLEHYAGYIAGACDPTAAAIN